VLPEYFQYPTVNDFLVEISFDVTQQYLLSIEPEEPARSAELEGPWLLRSDRRSLSATTVAGEKSLIGKIAHGQVHGLLQASAAKSCVPQPTGSIVISCGCKAIKLLIRTLHFCARPCLAHWHCISTDLVAVTFTCG
jgi:hypothetical protein